MKDLSKYLIEVKQGKHTLAICENTILAAVKLKQLCPNLTSQSILRKVNQQVGKSNEGERSKIGGMYHLKLISKENILAEKSELQLIKEYQMYEIGRKEKNLIFSELIKRYSNWLKLQSNRVFKSIPSEYFGMEFEDCESEALYGFKLAVEWFTLDKVSDKFDSSKFSIAYYAERQISARIGTYWYKYNKKQKRSVEYKTVVFEDKSSSESSTMFAKDSRNLEKEVIRKIQMEKLESKLSDVEVKIKNYLIEGLKETKIKSTLGLNESSYSKAKTRIGEAMKEIEFSLV